jgi:serpin B
MKKIVLILLGMVFFFGVNAQGNLVTSNNEFTFKIYKATTPDSTNFFISPYSLHLALACANEGAATTTRKEMDNLLCLKGVEARADAYQKLYKENDRLYLANSLWLSSEIKLNKAFKQTLEEKYHSTVFNFNRSNIPAASIEMNRWVAGKTHQNITELPGLSPLSMMSILNAVYFVGEWETAFDKRNTAPRIFYNLNGVNENANFMKAQNYYQYYEDTDVQSLVLNYKEDYSMVFLLPKERYGISKLEKKMSNEYLKEVLESTSAKEVIVSLPKFKIETELSPKLELMKMGYGNMFSDRADFSGISRTYKLKIDRITHKTFIEIDEIKTEAVAVTRAEMIRIGSVASMMEPQPPIVFTANHPFVFFIIDNRTRAVIFIGKYVKC